MDLEFPRVSGVILCLPKSSLLGHLPPLVLKHPGNGLEMPIKVKNKKAVMLGHCHARSLAVIAVTPPFFSCGCPNLAKNISHIHVGSGVCFLSLYGAPAAT